MAILAPFVAVLCLLSLPSAGSAQTDSALVRVYIDTRPDNADAGLPDRQQSGKDLAAALGGKKKLFTIVDDEARADVVLHVEGRAVTVPKMIIGISPRPGQAADPTMRPTPEAQLRVGVSLARADESVEMKNKNRAYDNPGGWKSAAEDIAKQIERWVGDRRAKILAARSKTTPRG
jgi:hypothetical protein